MNQDENYFWTNFIHRNPTNSVFIVHKKTTEKVINFKRPKQYSQESAKVTYETFAISTDDFLLC
jgi:hypothetical protein